MKFKKNCFIALFFLFLAGYLFSQENNVQPNAFSGDLRVTGTPGYTITATMKIASVPFEGITNPKPDFYQYNRVNKIQNGTIWRYFESLTSKREEFIDLLTNTGNTNGNLLDIGHCSGREFPDGSITGTWGFAKYFVTIKSNDFV